MNRGPSRKDERKNARLAKKQQRSLHHQKLINVRKGINPQVQAEVSKFKSNVTRIQKNPKMQQTQKWLKVTPASKQNDVAEDDDEEIFSDSDAYEEEILSEPKIEDVKKKVKSKSKSSSKKKKVIVEDDDFLSMIDEAFASGKLTKAGYVNEDGKVESEDYENSEDDFGLDSDLSHEDISMKNSSEDDEESFIKKEIVQIPSKSHSMLQKSLVVASPAQTSIPLSIITSVENTKLLRQIQSLVNKLGSSNLVPICNEFEGIFRNNRRKEVIELLTETIISSIVRPGGNLLDSFALNFAALAFIINHMVGNEFGAHLIEKLIETIDSLYIQAKSSTEIQITNEPNIHERSLVNCMNFCSFLYDLQMIASNLICDLIRQSAQRLDEIDVEIILKLFKTCGQQIKRDDADFMKVITAEISKQASEIAKDQQSSRFKFMIETINDLKDSKRKLASAMTVELEPVKKMLKNFLSQKLIAKIEPLRISLEDIRNIETKGKWWLIGSSWHPQDATVAFETIQSDSKKNDELTKLENLAKAQRMNTEIRKSIFSTIVSSDDYSDAFERLVAMKLTGKQEREIILVIVHCCGQEKVFNPFYSMLAGKFASYRQGFKVTLQYTLWDCLKQLREYPLRKLANIAKLYGMLLAQGDLALAVLRKGSFIRLKDEERIFWQLLFMTFFTRVPSDDELDSITQNLVCSIETGIVDNPTVSSSSGKSKSVMSLTENVDMAEFDDDFFAAQENIRNTRGMSPEKLEECKNLRNGIIYLLDLYFVKSNDFPFTVGVEICKKRAKRMKQILSK